MSYQLVLTESPASEAGRAFGHAVLLQNVPQDCKVYLFYFPGARLNEALESQLKTLGEETGNNLYVDIAKLNDPQQGKIVSAFGIKGLPVIVMSADTSLASPDRIYSTAFVRLDSSLLLQSPERTLACVQKLMNLFLQGKVVEAMSLAKWTQRSELLGPLQHFFISALSGVVNYLKETEISVSFVEGKIELKPKSAG